MAYTLEPLHSRPDLIEDTVKLLKEEWPESLAERLKLVETPKCTGLPCSLVLIETREGAISEVLGHVRVVPIHPESEKRVYIEAVAVTRNRRKQGLGRKLHQLSEEYAKNRLGIRYIHATVLTESNEKFYHRLGFEDGPDVYTQIAANILRTFAYASWEGLVIPAEWNFLYEGGKFLSKEEDKLWHRDFVKDLCKT